VLEAQSHGSSGARQSGGRGFAGSGPVRLASGAAREMRSRRHISS
jgi:hypothetical protein